MFCEELLSWTKGSDSKRRHEKESGGPGGWGESVCSAANSAFDRNTIDNFSLPGPVTSPALLTLAHRFHKET